MDENAKLLPLSAVADREFLMDIEKREFRDYDDPYTVIKMQGSEWNSLGVSTGKPDGFEV